MKKLLEKFEFLIHLSQQILKLLMDHPQIPKSAIKSQQIFLSVDQLAEMCLVQPRQVRRWRQANKIVPQRWIGSSPYFSLEYIENALDTGVLRMRKKRKGK